MVAVVDGVLQQPSSSNSASVQLQGSRRRTNANDFISHMPDEILVKILSFLIIKDAVVTSSVSTRWSFLWRSVNRMNFHAIRTANDRVDVDRVFVLEMAKYINQVNTVIQNNNLPTIQDFRIHFGFNSLDKGIIDDWLRFAVKKKVEFLELNFMDQLLYREYAGNYNFPSIEFERNLWGSNAIVVELVSLKKLILNRVNVSEAILQEFLKKSPHLETISIRDSRSLDHIHVGGRPLSLKYFEITTCCEIGSVKSIHLYDFDLLSFSYRGDATDFHLARLPKLKEIQLHLNLKRPKLKNNVFSQISSSASSLQSLCISTYGYSHENMLTLDSFPELPNLKKLKLLIDGDNCLLHLDSIVNLCPKLQTFTTEDDEIDFCLARLSKDVHFDMGHGLAGLNNNVYGQMLCSSPMQALSVTLHRSMESKEFDFFPELPNVKKLTLTAYGRKFNFLLDLASILNACPNLEIFTVEPFWTSPMLRRTEARGITKPHEHLKVVEIVGYYGRACDFELAAYIICSAVALKKIVIDTRFQKRSESGTVRAFSKNKGTARFSVESKVKPLLSKVVELVIL